MRFSHADNQMGRILDTIEAQGELANTLVIYIFIRAISGTTGRRPSPRRSLVATPGGHAPYLTHAKEFAEQLRTLLR